MVSMDEPRERGGNTRLYLLATVVLTAFLIVVGRFVYLQFWQPLVSHTGTVHAMVESTEEKVEYPPRRGRIFDRDGNPLAVQIITYEIGVNPAKVENAEALAEKLAPLLRESRVVLMEKLLRKSESWVRLAKGVEPSVAETIMEWENPALTIDGYPARVYPQGNFAGHVLGFVNEEQKAFHGVEEYYQVLLSGQPGYRSLGRDSLGNQRHLIVPAQDGADLVLTLDREVQYLAEKAISDAVTRYQAERGLVIVMDPRTGEILALAVSPAFDPNTYYLADQTLYPNPAVSDHYEPGSVFKIITMAAGLDAGLVRPETTYLDNGSIVVGGRTIRNSDRAAHGQVNMVGLLAHSLNVGAAYISTNLGATRFYDYVHRFGFGQLTGVDLANEVPGDVRVPGDEGWWESDLGMNAFGQGLAVTPLQIITAVAAVANNGILMKPHIVKAIIRDGVVEPIAPQAVRQVISPQTARELTKMLVQSVAIAAPGALVPGYSIAGKTGTAEIPIPGGYDPVQTIASFVAYAPADNPQFVALVVLYKPQVDRWGVLSAAPLFHDLAVDLFRLMGIPPDDLRHRLE